MIDSVGWDDWIRGGTEIEPSLYAADFSRLGEQVTTLLNAGARIFHFDVGDGHFVPPVTIGPVVLRSIAPLVHAAGGVLDCHLMVEDPVHHIPEFAASGADSVTFHVEAASDPEAVIAVAREHGLGVGVAFNPGTTVDDAVTAGRGADLVLCMSIVPGYSGQAFMPEAVARIEELVRRVDCPVQVDGGVKHGNVARLRDAGARLLVVGSGIFEHEDLPRAYRRLDRALT
jgi:ribulose-phosphate 3-epimerase